MFLIWNIWATSPELFVLLNLVIVLLLFILVLQQTFSDDHTRTKASSPCSNPGILAEEKGDVYVETNLQVRYQAHHLMHDVSMSINHRVPDSTEERDEVKLW
ncbi:unnamed protein product [Musa hybrid cultivar]